MKLTITDIEKSVAVVCFIGKAGVWFGTCWFSIACETYKWECVAGSSEEYNSGGHWKFWAEYMCLGIISV